MQLGTTTSVSVAEDAAERNYAETPGTVWPEEGTIDQDVGHGSQPRCRVRWPSLPDSVAAAALSPER